MPLDQLNFNLANVQPPTLTGRIERVSYWYPGLAAWLPLDPASPPSPPFGTPFYLAVGWVNTSPVDIVGHVDLTITRPDGTTVTPPATQYQDQVAAPGNGWSVWFGKEPTPTVTLDQVGLYQGSAVLLGGLPGGPLATLATIGFSATVGQAPAPGAGPWLPLALLGGATVALVALVRKR